MKIENKKKPRKIRKSQKNSYFLMSVASLYTPCVWCSVCFCTGHFVMVPLNLTCPHCLQHFFFEHLFHLYLLHIYRTSLFLLVSPGVSCWYTGTLDTWDSISAPGSKTLASSLQTNMLKPCRCQILYWQLLCKSSC